MVGATIIVKHNVKEKWVHSGYRIAFDGKVEWKFENDFARNVIMFSVDKSSSSHTNYRENNFLVLGEGPTYGINGTLPSRHPTSRGRPLKVP